MSLQLLELASWRGTRQGAGGAVAAYVRPTVENLEERTVMSSPASLAQGVGAVLGPVGHQTASFLPINITNIAVQTLNGVQQLVAQGTVAGHAFMAPITLSATPSMTPGACPILDLHLDSLNLNLLGLQVKTSPICLAINAESGEGELLGNLLCDLSNALNGGGSLGGFLSGLSTTDLNTLTSGLTNVLNGALGALTSPTNATVLPTSTTNILHLSVGPLNLNLLGLQVTLDNCNNGPVTVDINAVSGAGNLLGNLLSGIAHLADVNPTISAIDHLLTALGRDLNRLGL